jgi:6-phosphofructokinase
VPSISGLHLTDLHLKSKAENSAWPSIRDKFFDDLARLHERTGPWDLVLFTGDLVYSGKPEEFVRLGEWLGQLWNEFGKLGSRPRLLAIPGNHDLLRPDSKSPEVKALKSWHSDHEIRNLFLAEENHYIATVKAAFEHFSAWQKCPGVPTLQLVEGKVPGDFSARLDKDGVRLGIVGLNSSFLQLSGGDFKGQLELDSRQVDPICDNDIASWAKKNTLSIIMTHHPINWLWEHGQASFLNHIAPAGRFALHLYGHMHEPLSEAKSSGGSPKQISWQGESLFSQEVLSTGERRRHGYGAWRIDVDGCAGNFKYWPRTAFTAHGGGFNLGADSCFTLNKNDACEYGIGLVTGTPSVLMVDSGAGKGEEVKASQSAVLGRSVPHPSRRIGIITTGSDAPGLNACIRATVRVAAAYGIDVVGFQNGFKGLEEAANVDVLRGSEDDRFEGIQNPELVLLEDDKRPFFFFNSKFTSDKPAARNRRLMRQVSMIVHRGGSILLSQRYPEMKEEIKREEIFARICDAIRKHSISHLVIAGGEGSMTAACLVAEFLDKHSAQARCRILGVPASIENDLYGLSDEAIGYDTALNTAVSCIDRIRDTGDAMLHEHVIQVSGGDSSLLAAEAGIAAGAEIVVADDKEFMVQWKEADKLDQHMYGASNGTKRKSRIVVACESANLEEMLKWLVKRPGQFNRDATTKLGHVQRGGTPSARDRLIATVLGDWIARSVAGDREFHSETAQGEIDSFGGVPTGQPLLASLSGDRVGWAKLVLRLGDSRSERELDTMRSNRIEASFSEHLSNGDERSKELRKLVRRVSRLFHHDDSGGR